MNWKDKILYSEIPKETQLSEIDDDVIEVINVTYNAHPEKFQQLLLNEFNTWVFVLRKGTTEEDMQNFLQEVGLGQEHWQELGDQMSNLYPGHTWPIQEDLPFVFYLP